jgi:TrmH family RNA methyltransferase
VREALARGAEIEFAIVSPRAGEVGAARAAVELLRGARGGASEVIEVGDEEIAALASTEAPQGLLVVAREPRAALESVVRAGATVLVLDAIQDPGNVGTLVRSAVAFGFDGVVALDGTSDPWGAKSVRASAGTAFAIPVVRARVEELLAAIELADLPIVVASAGGRPVRSGRSGEGGDRGLALVLGNEGSGVRDEIGRGADETVAVVMRGSVESLNVAIAGSILMHELTRGNEAPSVDGGESES